jgi:hypothetical protein
MTPLAVSPCDGRNLTQMLYTVSRLEEADQKSVITNNKKEGASYFEHTIILEMFENRVQASWVGYLLLGIVIASGSAFVPLGVSLEVSDPLLKVLWRVQTLLPFIAPLGLLQVYYAQRDELFKPSDALLNPKNLFNLVIAAFAISFQQYCAIYAGKYTLMSHSVILVNLSGPVIVGYRLY